MKRLQELITPRNVLFAFGVSLSLSLCGNLILPELYSAGTAQADTLHPLIGAGIVLVAYAVALLLLTLFFESVKKLSGQKTKPLGKAFGGLLGTTGLLLVCLLVVSMLCGLLAVLIYTILKSSMPFDQIKGVISIAAMFLTWLAVPIFLNVLFTYGVGKEKVLKSFAIGVKIPAMRYVKFLVFAAAVYAAGWLAAILFRYANMNLPLEILQTAINAIIGTVALIFVPVLYPEKTAPALSDSSSRVSLTYETKEKEPVTVK